MGPQGGVDNFYIVIFSGNLQKSLLKNNFAGKLKLMWSILRKIMIPGGRVGPYLGVNFFYIGILEQNL